MKYIEIHGIGNAKPGFSDKWKTSQILSVPQQDIFPFLYEDLLEKDKINWWVKLLAGQAAKYYGGPYAKKGASYVTDYLNDIFVFFLSGKTRGKIADRLSGLLHGIDDDVSILGHSLGSIVAYWYLKNHPGYAHKVTLYTIGSPLGAPGLEWLVKNMVKVPNKIRPEVVDWFNVYSTLDPLSGKIEGLGCYMDDQLQLKLKEKVRHKEVDEYLQGLRDEGWI